MDANHQLLILSTAALAFALARTSFVLARIAPLPRPMLGHRGVERVRALVATPGFALIEPVMRWLAAIVSRLPLGGTRTRLERTLAHSGDFLGLCADECLALSALCSAGCAITGTGALALIGRTGNAWIAAAAVLGAGLPWLSLNSQVARRKRSITRQLPPAIDLLALCMGAGLDFTGALALLVAELDDPSEPLVIECKRLLEELSLGRTRGEALVGLAERVPSPAIRNFTAAVIQAEQKGNPLAAVLNIQARMMRMHRSVALEEAAARASVLLVLPMMLLLSAILLVMLGPFIANGFGL